MEKEDPNQKTKKINHSLHPTNLNQRQKMEKEAPNQKTKNNHHSQNQTDLNRRE